MADATQKFDLFLQGLNDLEVWNYDCLTLKSAFEGTFNGE